MNRRFAHSGLAVALLTPLAAVAHTTLVEHVGHGDIAAVVCLLTALLFVGLKLKKYRDR